MFFIPLSVLLAAGEEIQKTALSQMQAPSRITFQKPDNDACAECHTDSGGSLPEVTEAHLANSVHEGLDCISCHTAVSKLPHKEELPPPECKGCHADVAAIYKQHGRSKIEDSEDIPSCGDCHGSHDILPVNDRQSMVSPLNLPQTCARCHEDQELITRRNIKFKLPIKVYSQSVHGRAAEVGSQTAATCNDCHSAGGTAHMILPPGDSR